MYVERCKRHYLRDILSGSPQLSVLGQGTSIWSLSVTARELQILIVTQITSRLPFCLGVTVWGICPKAERSDSFGGSRASWSWRMGTWIWRRGGVVGICQLKCSSGTRGCFHCPKCSMVSVLSVSFFWKWCFWSSFMANSIEWSIHGGRCYVGSLPTFLISFERVFHIGANVSLMTTQTRNPVNIHRVFSVRAGGHFHLFL